MNAMANLVNLQDFDADLRTLGDQLKTVSEQAAYLEKDGWALLKEVRLATKPTRETNEKILRHLLGMHLVFSGVSKGLEATHQALSHLAHNNRDGRG
jgi:hypothetical protein